MKVYDIWCSGGKDSVAAALVALESIKDRDRCRLAFIEELRLPDDVDVPRPIDYVSEFADWLGLELIVVRPKIDYWEKVKEWGYPGIIKHRWCFRVLKKEPVTRFLEDEYKRGLRPTWVLGIRKSESRRREKIYKYGERYHYRYGRHYVEIWLPILNYSKHDVEEVIRKYNPPRNPLWKVGFSLECICLAGTSIGQLNRLIREFPSLAKYLAEMDEEVQRNRRRKEPFRPHPLQNIRMPLHEYIRMKLREKTLEDYIQND